MDFKKLSAGFIFLLTAISQAATANTENGTDNKAGNKIAAIPGKPELTLAAALVTKKISASAAALGKYKIELGSNKLIRKPGTPGALNVWIGSPKRSASFSTDMATAETTVPAIGQSARVTPIAAGFDITSAHLTSAQSICISINSFGSEAKFFITPKSTGTFRVGAKVQLYGRDLCTGAPVSKPTTLETKVVVEKGHFAAIRPGGGGLGSSMAAAPPPAASLPREEIEERTATAAKPPIAKSAAKPVAKPETITKSSRSRIALANGDTPKTQIRSTSNSGGLKLTAPQSSAKVGSIIKNDSGVPPLSSTTIGKSSSEIVKSGIVKNSNTLPAESAKVEAAEPISASATASAVSSAHDLDKYKVELGVSEQIQKPGPAGELKVWIGAPDFSANFSEDMTTAETTLPAIGNSARVTPNAPDFDVSPAESICMKIHPTGSETHFAITPKATGTFKVGADVLLYDSDVCTGSPVPKSAASLEVEVVVNKKGVAENYLLQLWEVLWQGILKFWTWLVATIAGLFVFLIRKRLKKWFGFDAPQANSQDD